MQKINWQSTNLWFNLIMLLGSFWGLSADTGTAVVSLAVAAVSTFGLVRQFITKAKFVGFLETLRMSNTKTYLATALALLGVPAAGDIVPALGNLLDGLSAQNWGLVFSAGFAIINILINIFKKKAANTAT